MDKMKIGEQEYNEIAYAELVKMLKNAMSDFKLKELAGKVGVTDQTVLNCLNLEKQIVKDSKLTKFASIVGIDLIITVNSYGVKSYYVK